MPSRDFLEFLQRLVAAFPDFCMRGQAIQREAEGQISATLAPRGTSLGPWAPWPPLEPKGPTGQVVQLGREHVEFRFNEHGQLSSMNTLAMEPYGGFLQLYSMVSPEKHSPPPPPPPPVERPASNAYNQAPMGNTSVDRSMQMLYNQTGGESNAWNHPWSASPAQDTWNMHNQAQPIGASDGSVDASLMYNAYGSMVSPVHPSVMYGSMHGSLPQPDLDGSMHTQDTSIAAGWGTPTVQGGAQPQPPPPPVLAIYCSECGTKYTNGEKFCPKDGNRLHQETDRHYRGHDPSLPPPPPPPPVWTSPWYQQS
mmetsp:Transcript_18390/g.39927  ORF Transcript_18390/g.39927 Transcript_18390/m.39927 type:complete len:310 (-) Transcript_18390:121-1050(-)